MIKSMRFQIFSLQIVITLYKYFNIPEEELEELTKTEKTVIEDKGTEQPFSGQYENFFKKKVSTCANAAMLFFLIPVINSVQIVVGPVLMILFPERLNE